jgi:hypothetical protein
MRSVICVLFIFCVSCSKKDPTASIENINSFKELRVHKITLRTNEDTSLVIKLPTKDVFEKTVHPKHGELSQCGKTSDGYTCSYTPKHNFYGLDYIRFSKEYLVYDVKIIVDSVNDPPIFNNKSLEFAGSAGTNIKLLLPVATDVDHDPGLLTYILEGEYKNYVSDCKAEKIYYQCIFSPPPLLHGKIKFILTASDGIASSESVTFFVNVMKGTDSDGDRIPDHAEEGKDKYLAQLPHLSFKTRGQIKVASSNGTKLNISVNLRPIPLIKHYYSDITKIIMSNSKSNIPPYIDGLENIYILGNQRPYDFAVNYFAIESLFKGKADDLTFETDLLFALSDSEHFTSVEDLKLQIQAYQKGTLSNVWNSLTVTGQFSAGVNYPFQYITNELHSHSVKKMFRENSNLALKVNDYMIADIDRTLKHHQSSIFKTSALISIVYDQEVLHHYVAIKKIQDLEHILSDVFPGEIVFSDHQIQNFKNKQSRKLKGYTNLELKNQRLGRWFLYKENLPIKTHQKVHPGDKIALVYLEGEELFTTMVQSTLNQKKVISAQDSEYKDFEITKIKTLNPHTFAIKPDQVFGFQEFYDENWMLFGYRDDGLPECRLSYKTHTPYSGPYTLEYPKEVTLNTLSSILSEIPLKQTIDGKEYDLAHNLKSFFKLPNNQLVVSYDHSNFQKEYVHWGLKAYSEVSKIEQRLEGHPTKHANSSKELCTNRAGRYIVMPNQPPKYFEYYQGAYPALYSPAKIYKKNAYFNGAHHFLSNCIFLSGSCANRTGCNPAGSENKQCFLTNECPAGHDRHLVTFNGKRTLYCYNPKFKTKEVVISKNYSFDVLYNTNGL